MRLISRIINLAYLLFRCQDRQSLQTRTSSNFAWKRGAVAVFNRKPAMSLKRGKIEVELKLLLITMATESCKRLIVKLMRYSGCQTTSIDDSKGKLAAPVQSLAPCDPKHTVKWLHCAMFVLVTSLYLAFSDADIELWIWLCLVIIAIQTFFSVWNKSQKQAANL